MSFSKMKEKDDREILKKHKSVFEKKKKLGTYSPKLRKPTTKKPNWAREIHGIRFCFRQKSLTQNLQG